MDPEFLKALELVAEYDRQRPSVVKEYRLYYDEHGCVIGLWETDHPDGENYIVLSDTAEFHSNNTSTLKIIDGKLKITDPKQPLKSRLIKSDAGFAVVRGHAALILGPGETYEHTEYYDRKTDH